MKKAIYTAIFGAMLIPALQSQITLLPAYHEPTIGIYGNVRYDSSVAIPRNTGANQTWDFSTFAKGTSAATTGTFVAASAAPHATTFPGATLAENLGSGEYVYYKSSTSPSQFEMLGIVQTTTTLVYSDSRVMLAWPIAYGTTYTDSYTGTMSGGSSGTYSGSHTMTATGSGTLILPGSDVLANVLQLKNTYADVLSINTGTTTMTLNLNGTSYIYYHGTQRYPVVTVNHSSIGDTSGSFSSIDVLVNHLVAVGLTDYNFDASFAIYPNPARDHFVVNFGNAERNNCVIEIYDMTGKLEKRLELGNEQGIATSIDIRDLSRGLHVVRTTLGDQRSTRKLIVE